MEHRVTSGAWGEGWQCVWALDAFVVLNVHVNALGFCNGRNQDFRNGGVGM